MPEHDDLFASFKTEGPPVRPLPASEVRRRGDRMRRRNNTVAAVGGVAAALVVIATPLAIVTSQSADRQDRPPVATQPAASWREEVPASFDLTTGMPETNGLDGTPVTRTDESAIEDLTFCGVPAWSATSGDPVPTVDVVGATYTGESEDVQERTLALYSDDVAAEQAMDRLSLAAEECAEGVERNPSDYRSFYEVVDRDLGADESYVITRRGKLSGERYFDGSLDVYLVARTGNAIVLDHTYGAGAGSSEELVQDQVTRDAQDLAPVVSDMIVFSERAATDAEDTGAADLGEAIPDDFDLLAGFPEQDAATGVGREGPSRDLDLAPYGTLVEACGATPAGLPEPTDTLDAGWREAAGGQLRRLMTFGSADDAQAYADAVMAVYADCPEESVQDRVIRFHETSTTQGVGDHAATTVSRFEVDGEPGPGHQVVQVVRVGQALLLFVASYDGADPVDPDTGAADLAATYLGGNQAVVAAM